MQVNRLATALRWSTGSNKVLEEANIKLAGVASDVMGALGRAMIPGLIAGEADASTLAELAKTRLRRKIPQLQQA